ncbi:hypothetical protein ABPG74_019032 [Tetrahymena malaccensis]
MSEQFDNQYHSNQNAAPSAAAGKIDTQENDYLYQKRPLTSYGQNNQQAHMSSLSNSQANIHNQRVGVLSPKFAGSLKANRSSYIRPSTVSTQNGVYDPSYNQSTTKSQKMPQINGQTTSGAFFFDKNQQPNKKIPNNILHDKEKLYENLLQLRNQINVLNEENLKLKTKNLNLEREAKKFERIIEEGNIKSSSGTANQQKENALSIRLRKQLKECLKEIEQKNIEFENFKRQITTTRLQELEIEVNVLREECIKLKSKLDQCLKVNQGFGFDQTGGSMRSGDGLIGLNKKVEALKNDNLEMAVLIQKLEKEKNEINVREKECDRQLRRLQKEKMFMQKQIQQQEEELRKSRMEGMNSPYGRKQSQNSNQNHGLADYNSKLKADLEKIGKENSKLNNQLIIKIEKIKELEDKQRRDTQEWQERIESIRIQKEIAERNYNQEQLMNKNLEDKIKALEDLLEQQQHQNVTELVKVDSDSQFKIKRNESQDSTPYTQKASQQQQQQQYSQFHQTKTSENSNLSYPVQQQQQNSSQAIHENTNKDFQKQQNIPSLQAQIQEKIRNSTSKRPSELLQKKLMPRVNLYDVNKIGKDLRFSLKTKKIRFEEIDHYLITPELRKRGRANIMEIVAILQKEPFCINNDDDALSVARYMVEDNSEDKLIFDEARSNDISVIKTVFRNLVGKYEILTPKEELKIHEDVSDIFTKFSSGLKENIQLYTKQKKEGFQEGVCKLEDLEKAMSYCDAEFSPRHTDYIIMKIYEDSKDTEKVYYDKLLHVFDHKEFLKYKERRMNEIEKDEIIENQHHEQQNIQINHYQKQEELENHHQDYEQNDEENIQNTEQQQEQEYQEEGYENEN